MNGSRRRVPAGLILAVAGALGCGAGNGGGTQGGAAGAAGGAAGAGAAAGATGAEAGAAAGAEAGAAASESAQQLVLPAPGMAWVIFGTDTVLAEVAGTPELREKGLMDRGEVPDGTGMLFVFTRSEERSFWMRDTHVPLDIAFFDDTNTIAGIKQMEALDETLTDSDIATALVLEVRQGWFAEQGIAVGTTAEVVFGPGLTVR